MNKEEAKKVCGENLKRLRIARGLSQEELAKALGYTNRSSINKIEVGRSCLPTSKLKRAAEVLGVSPLELFQEQPLDIRYDTYIGRYSDKPLFVLDFEELTDTNKEIALAYIKGLLDSQKGDKNANT